MDKIKNLFRKSLLARSLRFQIGISYLLLAMINIFYFGVMIFENQTDLLVRNFKYQSDGLVQNVLDQLEKIEISKEQDEQFENLRKSLLIYSDRPFVIFDTEGNIWHKSPVEDTAEAEPGKVSAELRRKSIQLGSGKTLFRSPFQVDLNEADFSANVIMSLTAKDKTPLYLNTALSIESIKNRQSQLYYQILLAVLWGIVFHTLFGIFVYRIIFQRVGILKVASTQMANGDLSARAEWKRNRRDELDELGGAFNRMAANVQEQVETITHLNEQIQHELVIGQEVQELFLPSNKILKEFQVASYYLPMRAVSGDIYNYFNFNKNLKGVFFADATGHGPSAALITAVTIMSLNEVIQKTSNPIEVMSSVNNMLSDRLQSTFYATGVFFLLDSTKNRIYYSNAGHNPPLLLRAKSKNIVELEKCGPPLGMIDDVTYEGRKFIPEPRDKLLIFSDGLVESENKAKEQFTLGRVKSILTECSDLPNAEIMSILTTQLSEHTHAYRDDVSVLLLEMP